MDDFRRKPTVFVSSTCYDLKQIREDIKEFFEDTYGFNAMLSEFDSFPVDPCIGTFENCLNNVDEQADLFVLIVGTRYGYVTDSGKSITNLEYLHAKAKGIPVFIFVSKQLYNNLPLWRSNKNGDFSTVVDNAKIFEFVSEIYDEAHQWIYTYENVRDIKLAMKNQLGLIFSDGLQFRRITKEPHYSILNNELPSGAIRAVIEKPFAWEYKFLAYVLKDEFDKLKKRKWDLKYGIMDGDVVIWEPSELLNDISKKLTEMMLLIDTLGIIINSTIQDAIGEPGVPSDLEMMIYASKRFAFIYERLVGWSLYFKSIYADDMFNNLLKLLSEIPKSALEEIDNYVNRFYTEITNIPDINDGAIHKIELICTLDKSNTDEVNMEMERLTDLVKYKN